MGAARVRASGSDAERAPLLDRKPDLARGDAGDRDRLGDRVVLRRPPCRALRRCAPVRVGRRGRRAARAPAVRPARTRRCGVAARAARVPGALGRALRDRERRPRRLAPRPAADRLRPRRRRARADLRPARARAAERCRRGRRRTGTPAGEILGASLATALAYVLPLLAMVVVLPGEQLASIGGFVEATRTLCTVYGGSVDGQGTAHLTGAGGALANILAIGFIATLATGGATWLRGANEVQAAAAQDGAAPPVLGRRSRAGAPVVVGVLAGAIATITMALAYESHLAGSRATSTRCSGSASRRARELPARLPEPPAPAADAAGRAAAVPVPGGMPGAVACTLLTNGIALLAIVELVYRARSLPSGHAAPRLVPGPAVALRGIDGRAVAGLALLAVLAYASGRRRPVRSS